MLFSIIIPTLNNLDYLKSKLKPSTKFLAVVKAFAYGNDAITIAKYLESLGVDYFAVAYTQEGVNLRKAGIKTKSGIMMGLGETVDEVIEAMDDLRSVDCQVLTLGQYLQPSPKHLPVAEFIHPDVFTELKSIGLEKGFRFVESGPLVRSSYHAEKHLF